VATAETPDAGEGAGAPKEATADPWREFELAGIWGPLADEFAPLHRVIAYDRPGMGHSGRARRDAHTMKAQAQARRVCWSKLATSPADHCCAFAWRRRGVALGFGSSASGQRARARIAPACNPYPWKPAWWARLSAQPIIGDLFCNLIIPWLGPPMSPRSVANNFWPAPVPVNYLEHAGVPMIFKPRAFRASAFDVSCVEHRVWRTAAALR
jgi:pimeloyl-ACP methyl ester carboxylesterase